MPLKGGQSLAEKCEELGHPIEHYLGHPPAYYDQRNIWLDVRRPEYLNISPESDWAFQVMAIVLYHNMDPNRRGELLAARLTVERNVFINNRAILFNTHIGEGAVIGAGAVVCSQDVPAYSMVVGNPARVIKHWNHEKQRWLKAERRE